MKPSSRESKNTRQALGRWGEELAADYLADRGYRILDRNARTEYGEIDLVARHEGQPRQNTSVDSEVPASMTVFVEVKTRSSTNFGFPEQAVDDRKQERLLAAAQAYLQAHPELGGDWRVDVIAIQRSRRGDEPEIIHFENALS